MSIRMATAPATTSLPNENDVVVATVPFQNKSEVIFNFKNTHASNALHWRIEAVTGTMTDYFEPGSDASTYTDLAALTVQADGFRVAGRAADFIRFIAKAGAGAASTISLGYTVVW